MNYRQARWEREIDGETVNEPLLAEKRTETVHHDDSALPEEVTRDELTLPELSEPEIASHYTRLSQMNYSIEHGPYPLGSCTMKYNPKFVEDLAGLDAGAIHPARPDEFAQGTLELLHELQELLAEIGGMDAVTLQPPAGAAGEFTGLLTAQAYHRANGEAEQRQEVIVPASAHGTNFASASLAGYDVVEFSSDDEGRVNVDALEAAVGDETAALMLTNPNTLGLFERNIEEIADIVHDAGGLLYYDGANLNALLGRARPGDMGFDIMHYNVHKTFASPHGGGGPGAGPIGVVDHLAEFLPEPHVREDNDGNYDLYSPAQSVGKVHGYQGNWLVLLKTYAYISRLGDEGLKDTSSMAVLNANYLANRIDLDIPYEPFHHEFVASAGEQDAAEFAKGMLDYGVHPPTTKWPEIVDEALMTEPTEAVSKEMLDVLAEAFADTSDLSETELADAPTTTATERIDQTSAARNPRLSWQAVERTDD
jgi:glycine dehydrogenase subunit 2